MRQRITAVAAAAALAIAGLVAGAGTAQADIPCVITGFTPTTVVVGLSPVTRTFNVRTSGCTRVGWDLTINDLFIYAYNGAPKASFNPYSNSQAGGHSVVASADNTALQIRRRGWADGFHLKRASSFGSTFNAGPEPVTKGKTVTVLGKLLRANWDTDRYQGYAHQRVRVQFRTPTGSFVTVRTVETNAYGWVRTTFTARRTGLWRLVYSGNSITGPATSVGDSVRVR